MTSFVQPHLFDAGPSQWPFGALEPGRYDMIMIDPPWQFETYSEAGEGKSAAAQYRLMSADELLALPVGDLARDDCMLWLWATAPLLDLAMACLPAWGFRYTTMGAWDKRRWGTGYVLRSVCEPFLIATRGAPKIDGRSVPNLISESRREHSRKPEAAYAAAERMMPRARRADLFSRRTRKGWEAWGDQTGLHDGVTIDAKAIRGAAKAAARGGAASETMGTQQVMAW